MSRPLRALFLAALFTTVLDAAASSPNAIPADRVYRNGVIFMADTDNGTAEALAIRDGRIVYVGSNQGLAPFVGAATVSVDLKGRFLMPGLVDGHMHPLEAGTHLLKCSLNYESLTSPNCSNGFRRVSTTTRPKIRTPGLKW